MRATLTAASAAPAGLAAVPLRPSQPFGRAPLRAGRAAARSVRPLAAAANDPFYAAANNAKEKLQEWARQQRLKERINSGFEAASRSAQNIADEAQRTARRVDEEYDVSGKAAEAARNVEDAARGFDSRYNFRTRVRNFFNDIKRALPQLLRQVNDFLNTPMGAVTFLFLFVLSVYTGVFWVILRWLFSLMWLFLLLGPLIINYMNARAMAEQQERYREYVREQQRRQQNPLYGTPFEDLFGGGSSGSKAGPGGSGRRWGKRSPMSSGEVIDVEASTIDLDD